jgi:hypothetical protein
MRLVLSSLPLVFGALLVVGCSPSPGDPVLPAGADGKPVTRRYAYECPLPKPGETSGTGTFEAIYTEIVSDGTGVAKCQNGACHGNGASNGSLALGSTKKDAFCGMVGYVLIQPHDCTSCDLCADEIKSATPGACGDDAGVNHACCVPCAVDGDAGTDAAPDAAGEAAVDEVPVAVGGFHDIVAPNKKGEIRMPKTLCGNRTLDDHDRETIKAWGRAGAPLY